MFTEEYKNKLIRFTENLHGGKATLFRQTNDGIFVNILEYEKDYLFYILLFPDIETDEELSLVEEYVENSMCGYILGNLY